jgi:adenylate cyclase
MIKYWLTICMFSISIFAGNSQEDAELIEKLYKDAKQTSTTSQDNIIKVSKWIKLLNEIAETHPYYIESNRNMASIYSQEHLYAEAITHFKKCVNIDKNIQEKDIDLLLALGNAYARNGEAGKAIELLTKIKSYHKNKNNQIGQINTLRQMVVSLQSNNDYKTSLIYNLELAQALKSYTADKQELATIYNNVGYNYALLKQYQDAIHHYDEAIKLLGSGGGALRNSLLINRGIAYYNLDEYDECIKNLTNAEQHIDDNSEQIYIILANVFQKKNDLTQALYYADKAENFNIKNNNKELLADTYFVKAEIYNSLYEYETAIDYYQKFLKLRDEIAFAERLRKEQLLQSQLAIERAEKELKLLRIEQNNNKLTIAQLKLEGEKNDLQLNNLKLDSEKKEQQLLLLNREKQVQEAQYRNQALETKQISQALLIARQKLDNEMKDRQLFTLDQFKKYQQLEIEKKESQLKQDQKEKEILLKDQQISKLEIAKEKGFRQNLSLALLFLGALLCFIYIVYRNKKEDHKKLTAAYTELEDSEQKVRAAEIKIKELLNQQLSGAVADQLLAADDSDQVVAREACIFFLDIRNFTPFVANKPPGEIIRFQNDMFAFMIDTILDHGGVVNTFLGDGFMATFGAPVSSGQDNRDAFNAAISIQNGLKHRIKKGELPDIRIGIGLFAGKVVAGNVGSDRRKQYSVNGQPVITASRLEQLNKEFGSTIVVSKKVYDEMPPHLKFATKFESVLLKGMDHLVDVAILFDKDFES